MKAIVQDAYGSTDVLKLRDIDPPAVGDGDVLVQVHAAGVEAGVWHLMTGMPYLLRLMGFGLRAPKNPVRGLDVAGRVEAVGRKVTRFKVGDEVFGACDGSFAEYACAREKRLAPKPGNLTFEQAAAVPISAYTALQAVRDKGRVRAGHKVLVIGASGGVGTFTVQLAKMYGADVTGVCSTAKADLVRSIGADEVIDYTREDFADGTRRYDVILDIAGNRSLSHLRRALTPKGILVIVGGEDGGPWLGGTERLLRAALLSPFVGQKLLGLVSAERQKDLEFLKELLEAGKITPVVERAYPLSEVPEAIRHLHNGLVRGKVVITVPGTTEENSPPTGPSTEHL
ncbi:NAD(P)-dependent alcohol dehydrogenase [Streptomyces sp. NPDC002659]|uniref:NAD(P)-dependent alcohol dehydrogenase n=1 Tax=Streptomyces sp. NPDC002659 TaxID=3364656 RepID=UPI0036C25AE3